jgi:sortase (surface protein transpeptidase)
LTLYTCTPIYTATDRLVITAPLVGVRSWKSGNEPLHLSC